MTVSERLRIIAINFNVASKRIVSGSLRIDAFPISRNKFNERRIDHGKSNSMGNVSHDGEGKGEERKEIDSNGLL